MKDSWDLHNSGSAGVSRISVEGGWGGGSGQAEDKVLDTFPPRILLSSALLSKNMKISNMFNLLEPELFF